MVGVGFLCIVFVAGDSCVRRSRWTRQPRSPVQAVREEPCRRPDVRTHVHYGQTRCLHCCTWKNKAFHWCPCMVVYVARREVPGVYLTATAVLTTAGFLYQVTRSTTLNGPLKKSPMVKYYRNLDYSTTILFFAESFGLNYHQWNNSILSTPDLKSLFYTVRLYLGLT